MKKLDQFFLSRAFKLSELGSFTTSPNPNVGCVIVRDKHIVGEGYHKYPGTPHAEIYALQQAGKHAVGATAYITLEPCSHYGKTPPCTEAIVNSGISRVVFSVLDPNILVSGRSLHIFQQYGISVVYNIMVNKAEEINKGFFKRVRTGLPWITIKLAFSLDGRICMLSGESKWITSSESRNHVQLLRAKSDVIISTSSTVISDNPFLNVRWLCLNNKNNFFYQQNKLHQPIRVIIDGSNRVKPSHNIIKTNGKVWLARINADNLFWPSNVSQLILPILKNKYSGYKINLISLLLYLGKKKINNILVESGPFLFGSLLQSNLVDELILYQSPKFLGHISYPVCFLPDLVYLNNSINFKLICIKKYGVDLCMYYKLK